MPAHSTRQLKETASGPAAPPSRDGSEPGRAPVAGLTWRSLAIAIVLTIVCGFWIRQAEVLVWAANVTESVPAIPGLAVLMLLVLLQPLVRLIGSRFALSRAEVLSIYLFVAIAVSVQGVGVLRYWLSVLTVPFHLATPSNGLAALQTAIPAWLAPKAPGAADELYVRSPTGAVPWSAWAVPMLVWLAFFVAVWVCMWCLVLLVRRRWLESERLTFPIVALPLEITADGTGRSRPRFFRDPLMWTGFWIAALLNLANMLHAVVPSVPGPGLMVDLASVFSPTTYKSVGPIEFWFRPELIGFGFLVPCDILFSAWFFWLAARLVAFGATLTARDVPGVPFEMEQGMGAYLLLGVWLLWQVRHEIGSSLRREDRTETVAPTQWVAWGFLASLAFLCCFCLAAGMAAWVAALYLCIVLITAVVIARVRAEAGVPLMWLFPVLQQKKVLLYTFGSAAFMGGGVPATLTILVVMTILSRGYFASLIGYQVEGLKIAEEARISRRGMGVLGVLAVVVGLGVGAVLLLGAYYRAGAENIGNGMIWGQWTAFSEYTEVVAARGVPLHPDLNRIWATGAGAAISGSLLFARSHIVGFPFSAIGYAVAMCCGSTTWFPFLVVWSVKSLMLKYGGMKIYRRAIPFFLGLALGHFFVAGVLWGALGAFWPDATQVYRVWFG